MRGGSMKKILLVEDDEAIRNSVVDLFEVSNFNVKAVDNGRKALKLLSSFAPDVIVTDIMMPEMDGVELLSEVKQNLKWKDIPVIMLTAKVLVADRLNALSQGADGYICKPFKIEELLYTIINVTKLRESVAIKTAAGQIKVINGTNHLSFLETLNEKIASHPDKQPNLDEMAATFQMSPSGFQKKLKRLTGSSFSEYVNTQKLERARDLIQNGQYSMKEIAAMTGYRSASYFSTAFKSYFGKSPTYFIKK
ncbi:conserved hypothetical protein [Imperialibacter sp. EC-SDR9]|nr:conserved hypothetical protein [Imperialibacter sp. 89]VVT07153.1 conserved hypothetical protein [Imperialibacter sp. EC-SDR9]